MTGQVELWEIFLFILLSSLLSFGGGNGQIPVIQGRWVETGVLSPRLFSFVLALAYLTPGPKSGFIAGVGYYLGGWPGAVAAMLGLVIPTCIGAGAVSYATNKIERIVELVTPSSGFVLAALIAASAWGIAQPLQFRPGHVAGVVAVAVLVIWRQIDPIWLVLGAVAVGTAWSVLAAT